MNEPKCIDTKEMPVEAFQIMSSHPFDFQHLVRREVMEIQERWERIKIVVENRRHKE